MRTQAYRGPGRLTFDERVLPSLTAPGGIAKITKTTRTRRGKSLHNLPILGLILVVLGVGGLHYGHFSYHNWAPAVNAGPIHLDARMEHRISVPTVTGFIVLLAGIGFIAIRWRRG